MSSRILRLLVCLWGLSFAASADPLQQLLEKSGVPAKAFTSAELAAEVSGDAVTNDARVIILYAPVNRLDQNVLVGPRVLVSFDKKSGMVKRSEIPDEPTKMCGSSVGDLRANDEFILVETHINPSAACTLIFDDQLKLQKTLYGFGAELVAPAQVIMIEDMVHFAPVHPERLQLVDLHKWTDSELYPPKGDILRRKLIAAHAAKMPSEADCTAHNESCEAAIFDEEIRAFHSSGRGRFAFIAHQSASHMMKDGDAPETVAAQTVLYVYQQKGAGWTYCQQELKEAEVETLSKALDASFNEAASRCLPTKVVYPDLKTQKYNPFIH
jgi:hypothetical protein